MGVKRKQHRAGSKAQVAMGALAGDKTLVERSLQYCGGSGGMGSARGLALYESLGCGITGTNLVQHLPDTQE
ncbi:MAG: hypothetical protein ACREWG_04695 [Gammaproteobacteria bacterium]